MGLKRLLLLVVFAAAMSLGLASSAPAGNFDEERMGCTGEDPATCPAGTTGEAYSLPVILLGDEDTACATFYLEGNHPPGLNITKNPNESNQGRITGTPTQAGSYDFYLKVTYDEREGAPDWCGKPASDDRFIININPGLAKLTLGPESTSPGTVGLSYSLQMTATVADPKTWTISSGALPPGLAIDANTGLISGTPTTAGQFDFQVSAKMNADIRNDTKSLSIVVRAPVSIVASDPFTETRRAPGEVTAPFEAMLTASGGSGTYTWALSSGTLPAGLLFADGAISGTPNAAGAYPFVVTATDSEGRVANYPGRVVVAEKLAVSTLLLRPGRVGKLYAAKVRTTGGVRPSTWRIQRGPLPRGVRFDRTTGQLYGIPRKAGRYRIVFEATDVLGVTAKKSLRIVVAAAPKPKKKR